MKNKITSKILALIGITIGFMTLIFDFTLRKEIGHTTTLTSIQFWIGILIAVLVLYLSYYFSKIKETKQKPRKKIEKEVYDLTELNDDEKKTMEVLIESKEIMQKELIEKLKINKVKMTRVLNKLEEKGLIVRERHGMNNVVVLKN